MLYSKTNKHSTTNTSITDKYKLRVWVDYNVDSTSWNKDSKFSYKFKIGIKSNEVEPSLDTSGANEPVLDESMIPVYYDETSETWKKADESNSNKKYKWYDYDNKMWANSVTVSSDNRSTYQKASLGTPIPMDDILTMQVWIPRYKYKVWNYNSDGEQTSNEQEIEITFEDDTASTGEITCQDAISGTDGDPSETCKLKSTNTTCTDETCNNKTYTHPAFTFGDKEIKGFWIGKFELTGAINNITTKPDLTSLTNQKISTFATNIMNMKNSGNSYGLSTNTDTHMIKNMEWGAVAYLSHSKYGTCTNGTCKEVNLNNSSNMYTGRSAGTSNASSEPDGIYKYNQNSLVTTTISGGTEVNPTLQDDIFPWAESENGYVNEMQSPYEIANLQFEFIAPSNNTYLLFDYRIEDGVNGDILYYTIKKDGEALPNTGKSTAITETRIGTNKPIKLEKGSYTLTFTFEKYYNESFGYVENVKIVDNPTVKVEKTKIGEGQDGPSASTTHNIYGVYDMSGGAYEYTMGNMVSPDGKTMMSGTSSSYNSGYTGIVYVGGYSSYTGKAYPDSRYYDKYSFGKSRFSRIGSKLGDGLKEVYKGLNEGWYSDYSSLASSIDPWFIRGGYYHDVAHAGAFDSLDDNGIAYSYNSSRLVITP